MPNTPDRGKQQPGSSEKRKGQQSNDGPLQDTDDDTEEGRIEAPGVEEDDEVTLVAKANRASDETQRGWRINQPPRARRRRLLSAR